MCDTVIDEHFRRSLGNNYMELFDKATGAASGTVSPTGIAEATGTTKTKAVSNKSDEKIEKDEEITVQAESNGGGNVNFSVDDHFAKALGETWNKLKATQKKGEDGDNNRRRSGESAGESSSGDDDEKEEESGKSKRPRTDQN